MYRTTPMLDALSRLRANQQSTEPFRVVGLGPVFFPNLAGIYGYEDIRAHDPMSNGRYLGVLRVHDNFEIWRYFAKWNDLSSRTLDFLNVKYVLADVREKPKDTERYTIVYEGKDGKIFENHDVLPRFYPVGGVVLEFKRDVFVKDVIEFNDFGHAVLCAKLPVDSDQERTDLLGARPPGSPNATLRITSASPTDFRMQVSAPRYTMIASSTPFWPGWKVTRNGRTIRNNEINGAFLGFVVPPGQSDIHVFYDPWTFKLGVLVSAVTLLGLVVPFAGWPPFRRPGSARSE
jgi:uncharacterized membrane protein YfhO